MDSPLDVPSVRVLGSLIEKASTTPDTYPLTLNALIAACNQTTNRDPVLQLDEGTVAVALDELSRRQLVRGALRSDSRVPRYRHLLAETLSLHDPEIAVLGVLLLRGPQTVGEIRTRTARLYEFPDLARVELALQSLASLTERYRFHREHNERALAGGALIPVPCLRPPAPRTRFTCCSSRTTRIVSINSGAPFSVRASTCFPRRFRWKPSTASRAQAALAVRCSITCRPVRASTAGMVKTVGQRRGRNGIGSRLDGWWSGAP